MLLREKIHIIICKALSFPESYITRGLILISAVKTDAVFASLLRLI